MQSMDDNHQDTHLTTSNSQNTKKLPRPFSKSRKNTSKISSKPTASTPKLDYSDETQPSTPQNLQLGNSMGSFASNGVYDTSEMSTSTPKESIFSYLSTFTQSLDFQTLNPILIHMREHLMSKNVASDVATHLCDSIQSQLIGTQISKFSSLQSLLTSNMEKALQRILTPKTSIDLLRDILDAKKQSRPFSMCFIGVNGVGKSTNLSKVCFWLLQNKLKVLIAACDTFRAGAVEQLRVHVRNLKTLEDGAVVDLYDKGYGKDPAAIAKEAISYATKNNYDVILIDTAGRMQNNEPLMRALAKLVSINNPDKIVFVGEALVGNEAVDQLSKFNQALVDFSGKAEPRQIDAIILSKFDTIDDKVGAALSMTFTTGKPILFVGTGQTYTDLQKMNVKSIVDTLLSKK